MPGRVAIFTDAAVYDNAGVIWRITPKAVAISHLKAVIAARGPALTAPLFAFELGGCSTTFDALLKNIEGQLPRLCQKHAALLSADSDPTIELLIAGWSDARNRPESYLICSGPRAPLYGGEDLATMMARPSPGKLLELPGNYVSPGIWDDAVISAGLHRPTDGKAASVELLGLATLELQLGIIFEGARWVGGFGLMHVITNSGVTEKVICRWPDQLGEPINLDPVDWDAWRKSVGWPKAKTKPGPRAQAELRT
jgi:hypothetical protein